MRDVMTRLALGCAAAATIAMLPAPAEARRSVYATQYCARDYDGAMDCSYFTLHQCLKAVWATGGDCAINPRYVGEPVPEGRRAQQRYYR